MAGVKGQKSGGHNAKTRKELEAAGTYRKDRHQHRSPDPPQGEPTPPKPIEGDALEEWQRMIGRLKSAGTLSVVDDGALYQYCQLFAETEDIARAQAETAASARIVQENFDGQSELTFEEILQAAQEITKLRKLEASYITKVRQGRMALRMLLTEFGLTPASRGRVKLPDSEEQIDEFAAFQNKKPGLVRVK